MALKKLTLLEDLGISTPRYTFYEDFGFSSPFSRVNLFKSVCESCPHLEKLRVTLPSKRCGHPFLGINQSGGLCDISTMCMLRSLELFHFDLTSE
jgi:hypothetical protein